MSDRDVLGTSRNTLWSSCFILYLWIHAVALFLLRAPLGYLLGIGLTAALELWRHSSLDLPPRSLLHRVLAPLMILPEDHAWHHSRSRSQSNFAANWKIWDHLHGTAYTGSTPPKALGLPCELSLGRKLLWPFEARKEVLP
jgi:sterol desaturase/sphingolipid hydroxylase (fatty acid hydroxylase superfamily)